MPVLFKSILIAGLVAVGWTARAAFVIDATQQGNDVVFTGSGSLNTTALTNVSEAGNGNYSAIWPVRGDITIGGDELVDSYQGFTGPTSYGSGGFESFVVGQGPGGTASGDSVGIYDSNGVFYLDPPQGYQSGAPLSATTTYDDTTISALGMTPGIYVWSWGSAGPPDTYDTFTLDIAPAVSAPLPSGLPAGLLGLVCLGCYARQKKRIAAR